MNLLFVALALLTLWRTDLPAQESFYTGKTLRVIVGSGPGNTQDQMTRLIARFLPKYLPGHPNTIVENRGGASSLILGNYLFTIAKGDGLTATACIETPSRWQNMPDGFFTPRASSTT